MDTKKRRTMITKKTSEMVLKKHVGLIHCENKLTLIQRKICNILLFNALDNINDQEIHEIPLRKLCSLVGYNSNDSKLIKASIKTLISVVMEWNLLEDNKFLNETGLSDEVITWNASSLLAGASIKNGLIYYSYSPQIKSVLSSLDIYGRINLFVQAKFNSSYSLVLYENCVRFKNIKQTGWFPLDLFRSLMGVSENKYTSFKEFKRNVINVAVKEINQKSDIYLEPQFKKSSRQITAIQFDIIENPSYQPTFRKSTPRAPEKQSSLQELLVSEYRMSDKQAQHVTGTYPHEYILEKVELVKTKNNIDHPGAYLLAALKNDYQEKIKPKSIPDIEIVKAEVSYLRQAKQASEIISLKNKYMSYKLKVYIESIQGQVDDIQQLIKKSFEQFLKPNGEIFRFYKKTGLLSPFVMSNFIHFVEEQFPHVIGEYLSFDDFISAEE